VVRQDPGCLLESAGGMETSWDGSEPPTLRTESISIHELHPDSAKALSESFASTTRYLNRIRHTLRLNAELHTFATTPLATAAQGCCDGANVREIKPGLTSTLAPPPNHSHGSGDQI